MEEHDDVLVPMTKGVLKMGRKKERPPFSHPKRQNEGKNGVKEWEAKWFVTQFSDCTTLDWSAELGSVRS
jgi:hypothetical protein